MRFSNVSILGLGHADAPIRVSSASIEARLRPTADRLGINLSLLSSLTGIDERRFWPDGVQPSDAAVMAGEAAIADAGIDRSKIGAVISTSVCKDYIEPSVASIVHHKLGLAESCINFDVGNACLAFLNGMVIIGNMIERGQIDYGLVVDGEGSRFAVESTITRLLDPGCDTRTFRDNFATLTLGSGAAAMVLCREGLSPVGHEHRLVGCVSLSATEHNSLCRGQPDEMLTDAGALLTAGLDLAGRTYARARDVLGWAQGYLDEVFMHQVSGVHTEKLCEALEIDMARVYRLYPTYGNVGPASIPIAFSKAHEEGRLRPGDRIGLLGIGSGLNCAMMEVSW